MPILPLTADYTDRDFESARRRLFDLVRSARPEWAEETVANVGNLLVELGAHVIDVLSFVADSAAAEAFTATAQRRESMIAHGRAVGYELATAAAATALIRFTLDAPATAAVTIPAGTVIRTVGRVSVIRFRLLADVVIGIGEIVGEGTAENSTRHSKSTAASGLPWLDVHLDQAPYIDGSIEVESTGDGGFEQRASLLSSGASDRHFSVAVDSRDRATVRFGDGVSGKRPTGTITIGYSTGGGAAGNVEAGSLTALESTITDAEGRTVRISATNPAAASGGSDRETVALARVQIPESVRAAGSRCITRDDYQINARAVPGVARALMVTSNEDPAAAENAGLIFVVPDGGGVASEALRASVLEMVTVTRPGPPTFAVEVLSAIYREISVSVRATFSEPGAVVAARIRAVLTAWFALLDTAGAPNANVGFGLDLGGLLAWSDVFNAVRDTAGVKRIQPFDLRLQGAAADVALLGREFPVLGAVEVIDAQSGLAV